ncbi:hypothetical protein AXF42_Ash002562 [Apostasia shenzhenica]|uniref:Uncharacterized protein n=1 Tax=Apostasia shenzhenica TaxID=1088818 RepID=A0A2I0ANW8_9ASPA|nr:hypothetical protein AXF42_Ash002562 [Apostasia shenzhenica]
MKAPEDVDVGCRGPRKHRREREFREMAARKWMSLLIEAQGEDSVQGNQKSTQRFKVVQGRNPLRPPVRQRRSFTKWENNPKTGLIQCFVIKKKEEEEEEGPKELLSWGFVTKE